MKKKKIKRTGKELAKLNKRKKFYDKFYRMVNEPYLLLSMNKGISFPEYDELSKIFEDQVEKFDKEIDFEEIKTLNMVYYEEAHFLLNEAKSQNLKILRRETFIDDDGNERRGHSGADKDYNYQSAFNWGFQIQNVDEIKTILEKQKAEPSEYDLTPPKAFVQEPVYRKSYKLPRRRRR